MKVTIIIINIINNLSKFYLNSLFNFISKFWGAKNNKHLNAYLLPFIFAKFNPNISADAYPFVSYTFGMFILNLAVLVCFVNIIGYILSLYLVNKYDINKRFPKLKGYINFYKTTNKFFLILEIIIAFIILIFLVLFLTIYSNTN